MISTQTLIPVSLELTDAMSAVLDSDMNDFACYSIPYTLMWSEGFISSVCFGDGFYCVKSSRLGENVWFYPVGDDAACRAFLEDHFNEPDFKLIFVPEDKIAQLEEWFPGELEFKEKRSSFEYIVSVDEHCVLTGKKYRICRSHLNKAMREHEFKLEVMTDDMLPTAVEILKDWRSRHTDDNVISDESDNILLNNRSALKAEFYIVSMDGEAFAVLGGYPINDEVFELAIAKERYHAPGVSYAVKRLLFEHFKGRYRFVNLEDDMGIPGLRQMKNSMCPVKMNKVLNVWRKA